MNIENKMNEYNSLNENMRWFSNIRLVQLTLLLAISGALINALFSSPSKVINQTALSLSGIMVTVIFWVLEERTAAYWRHLKVRVIQLEQELNYKQYSIEPPVRIRINTTVVLRVLYLGLISFWISTFLL